MFFKQIIKFLKYFGKGYYLKLIYTLFFAFMSSLLEFASIALVFPFILMLINPIQVINSPFAQLLNKYIEFPNNETLIAYIGLLFLTFIIIKNIYSILIIYWQNKIIGEWCLNVKEKMMKYFLYSPYEADIKNANSNIIFQITKNIEDVFEFFVFKAVVLVSNTFVILIIFGILIYILPVYTSLAMIFFIVASLVQDYFFTKTSAKISEEKYKLVTGNYNSVISSLTCIKDIKINGCQQYFFNIYKNISRKLVPLTEKLNLIPFVPQHVFEIIFVFTLIIMCFGIFEQYGTNTTNVILALSIVAVSVYRLAPQIYKSQICLNYIKFHREHVEQLFKVYEEYSQYEKYIVEPTTEKMSFDSTINIKNLSYSYNKSDNVLTDINLSINKGEFIGIIGLSGAGKSTLIDCLLGLLNYNGDIYIDDSKLSNSNIRKFQNIVGYVPQETNTIEGTVKQNVAWGIEDSKIDTSTVINALKEAQLYEQLVNEKEGIETLIHQDGTGLSQGQKQRVGIARALYRLPEIIILDEATSNLDVKVENELTQILTSLKKQKTIIAIAHRISTLLNCDRIVYLKDGKIVDMGTFEELSSKYTDFEEIIKLSKIKID